MLLIDINNNNNNNDNNCLTDSVNAPKLTKLSFWNYLVGVKAFPTSINFLIFKYIFMQTRGVVNLNYFQFFLFFILISLIKYFRLSLACTNCCVQSVRVILEVKKKLFNYFHKNILTWRTFPFYPLADGLLLIPPFFTLLNHFFSSYLFSCACFYLGSGFRFAN